MDALQINIDDDDDGPPTVKTVLAAFESENPVAVDTESTFNSTNLILQLHKSFRTAHY